MITVHNFHEFRYFDFSRHWTKKLNPIIQSPQAQAILQHDFEDYSIAKAKQRGSSWRFVEGQLPAYYDSCDWRYNRRLPAWKHYVCHGACHYIVNTLLYIAMAAYPNRAWRIVTSSKHSTIWDGDKTLFDLNFLTLKVPVHECIEDAFMQSDSAMLDYGQYLR
jgi:hypothetical protein